MKTKIFTILIVVFFSHVAFAQRLVKNETYPFLVQNPVQVKYWALLGGYPHCTVVLYGQYSFKSIVSAEDSNITIRCFFYDNISDFLYQLIEIKVLSSQKSLEEILIHGDEYCIRLWPYAPQMRYDIIDDREVENLWKEELLRKFN